MNVVRVTPSVVYPPRTGRERRSHGLVEARSDRRTPDDDPGFEFVGTWEVFSDGLLTGEAPDLATLAMALLGCDVADRTTGADPPGRLARSVPRRRHEGVDVGNGSETGTRTGREWRSDCVTSAMCRPPRGPPRTGRSPVDRVRCRERTVRTVYHRGVASATRPMEGAH